MHFWLAVVMATGLLGSALAEAEAFSFGVLNQRSATLTAQYWNPILEFVGRKAGVTLALRMGKDVPETNAMTRRGEFDFVYSNLIFTPDNSPAGYRVILRPNEDAIHGQIVVTEDSPLGALAELRGLDVGFPSTSAFIAYAVPMDHLMRSGIDVVRVFGGNQEGTMAQLRAGRVKAAAINSAVMRDYAHRSGFRYRVLWSSPEYLNLPIAVHPRVPAAYVERVRQAFDQMDESAEGAAILQLSAAAIGQKPPLGFRVARDDEYASYRNFYRTTVFRDFRP